VINGNIPSEYKVARITPILKKPNLPYLFEIFKRPAIASGLSLVS